MNQAAFLRGFFLAAEQRGLDYFVMEAFDQPWKTSFEGRAAGLLGHRSTSTGSAKWPMTGPVLETPSWPALGRRRHAVAAACSPLLLLSRRPDIRLRGQAAAGRPRPRLRRHARLLCCWR